MDSYTSNLNKDSFNGLVEGKVQEEIGKISTSRSEYVSNLEGTGLVGISEY